MTAASYLFQGAKEIGKSVFGRAFYSPHWRIGWRFVNQTDDVWSRGDLGGTPWQALPNEPFRFFADPFPVVWGDRTFLFFEDFDHRIGKGRISAINFGSSGPTGKVFPVLEQPWHLSFPFIFENGGSLWMLPESSQNRTVSLYRADSFPSRWVKEIDLLTGIEASDSVIVPIDGVLWMFTTIPGSDSRRSDALCLFYSRSLFGPWLPHAGNPVLIDGKSARSAGPTSVRNGVLCRPIQDCEHRYGAGLGLAEITRLDSSGFEQKVRTVIRPGRHWPGWRFHTLSRAGLLECIDGSAIALRRTAGLARNT
jgi:hypothetical protein